jgi:hypothetical protein
MVLSSPEHAVKVLIAEGTPLDQIEERIDELTVDGEQRSALWLLAWATVTNPAARKRMSSDLRPRLD